MNTKTLTDILEDEWMQPDGFLGQLRLQSFDKNAFVRFTRLLQSIDFEQEVSIDKRLVALLWFVPTFMMWQVHSLEQVGVPKSEMDTAINEVINQLYRILGVP